MQLHVYIQNLYIIISNSNCRCKWRSWAFTTQFFWTWWAIRCSVPVISSWPGREIFTRAWSFPMPEGRSSVTKYSVPLCSCILVVRMFDKKKYSKILCDPTAGYAFWYRGIKKFSIEDPPCQSDYNLLLYIYWTYSKMILSHGSYRVYLSLLRCAYFDERQYHSILLINYLPWFSTSYVFKYWYIKMFFVARSLKLEFLDVLFSIID